jgi:hypothetical protein
VGLDVPVYRGVAGYDGNYRRCKNIFLTQVEKGEPMKESIPRSKVVRERAKAAQVRVGKQAIATTLNTEARGAKKLEKVMEAAAGENPGYCYAVLVDTQGVAYLRVEETDKGAKYVITTGAEIQVVELDNGTIRSRGLKVVPEASVAEAAGILARPLVKSVIISTRANEYLNKILSDKEFMTMATATKKAKKAATKSSAAAKTGKSKAKTTGASKIGRESLEEKAAYAVKVLTGKKGGLTRAEFAAELKKKYPSSYSTTKRLLIDGGYLKIDKESGAVSLAK